jgi:hypothetical protein
VVQKGGGGAWCRGTPTANTATAGVLIQVVVVAVEVEWTQAHQTGVQAAAGGSGIVILKYLAKPNMQIFQADGSWTCPTGITEVEYLVVAGGGGGGSNVGGGGGAGGYRAGTGFSVSAGTTYSITVGAGGTGNATDGVAAGSGNNSVFSSTITSAGGGGGG